MNDSINVIDDLLTDDPRVVPVRGPQVAPSLDVKRARPCICAFVVDEASRTVECSKCGKKWEAFDALLHVATEWRRFSENRKALRQELASLGKDREKLKHEVKLLKAQRKRAAV